MPYVTAHLERWPATLRRATGPWAHALRHHPERAPYLRALGCVEIDADVLTDEARLEALTEALSGVTSLQVTLPKSDPDAFISRASRLLSSLAARAGGELAQLTIQAAHPVPPRLSPLIKACFAHAGALTSLRLVLGGLSLSEDTHQACAHLLRTCVHLQRLELAGLGARALVDDLAHLGVLAPGLHFAQSLEESVVDYLESRDLSEPVTELELVEFGAPLSRDGADRVLRAPALRDLSRLTLGSASGAPRPGEFFTRWALQPERFERLLELEVRNERCDESALSRLAEAQTWSALSSLKAYDVEFTGQGAVATLFNALSVSRLQSLKWSRKSRPSRFPSVLGAPWSALLCSSALHDLKRLTLDADGAAITALAESRHLERLEHLELAVSGGDAASDALRHLLASPTIGRVQELTLSALGPSPRGVEEALGRSAQLHALEALTLRGVRLDSRQGAELALAPWFKRLRVLKLRQCKLNDGGLKNVLSGLGEAGRLEELDVTGNAIQLGGLRALCDHALIEHVHELLIGHNPFSHDVQRAAQVIARAEMLPDWSRVALARQLQGRR